MRRLPTTTRQLAERRARLAGEVPRLERLVADATERLAKVRAELAAVDLILPTFDARVDPQQIAPVKAQGARYGKRGTFKEALLQVLQDAAPRPLSTVELSLMLRRRFELEFTTPDGLKHWTDNVLRKQLRRLAGEGVLEKLKVSDGHSDDAYWRIAVAPAEGPLDELRAVLTPGQLAVRAPAGCTPDE